MKQLTSLKATLAGLEPAKLASLAVAALAVLALVGWIATHSAEPMGLLYSGLDPAEAGRIGQRLDEMKVPYENRGDGTTIMVPASQVGRMRMDLAAAGMPRQGGSGYELLDTQSPMSMTSFMQRVQRLRALEGELARTITTLDGVKAARVHIVMPERESFARDTPKPTASVAVSMFGPTRLPPRQAMAIRLLVAGAVPGLKQDDVSVLDPSGVVLAADDGDAMASSRLEDMKASREQALERTVSSLLEPLVGAGHVKTAVSLEIDASREVSREEKFDPNSQVERSKHTQNDKEATEEARNDQPVSVGQNVPSQTAAAATDDTPAKNATSNVHAGETVNYELNSVRSETVREPGELKRLAVAVVVDGTTDSSGTFHPRPQEQLDRIAELVRSAVGFDAKRGDKVTVETMRFIPPSAAFDEAAETTSGGMQSLLLPVAGVIVVLLVAGVAVFIMRRRRGPVVDRVNAVIDVVAQAGQDAIASLAAPEPLLLTNDENRAAATLNNIFDTNPEEAVALLRAWIAEGTPS
jgi:flagellar M-ring protein FliF